MRALVIHNVTLYSAFLLQRRQKNRKRELWGWHLVNETLPPPRRQYNLEGGGWVGCLAVRKPIISLPLKTHHITSTDMNSVEGRPSGRHCPESTYAADLADLTVHCGPLAMSRLKRVAIRTRVNCNHAIFGAALGLKQEGFEVRHLK